MHPSTLSLLACTIAAAAPARAQASAPVGPNDLGLQLEHVPSGIVLHLDGGPAAGRAWLFADVEGNSTAEDPTRAPGALVACLRLDAWGCADLPLDAPPETSLRALASGPSGSLAGARWSDAWTPATGPRSAGLAGDILIVEFLSDPTTVADSDGEWVEVFNATPNPIDLEGWTLADLGSDSTVLDNGGQGIVVQPYRFFVLGRNLDYNSNGGVDVDFEYSGMTLSNTADEIVLLHPDGTLADQVVYDSAWPREAGRAVNLARPFFEPIANDDVASWCLSSSYINNVAPDQGTPGSRNDRCPNYGG